MARTEIKWDDVDFNADPPVKTEATVEVTFSYRDSGAMLLDLSDEHAKQLDEIMATWLEIATPFRTAPTQRATRTPRTDGDTTTRVSYPVDSDGNKLTPAELKALRKWAFATDGETPVAQYDNGGYKYDAEQTARWDAARKAVKNDDAS